MLNENVKRICKEHHASVLQLERTLGFQRSSISKWNQHGPSVFRVKAVADFFQISIDEILRDC